MVLLAEGDPLHIGSITANGRTLGENIAEADVFDADVIRPLDKALAREGGLLVLRGSLAPDGAVIKHTAASPGLLKHKGRAVTFADRDDLARPHAWEMRSVLRFTLTMGPLSSLFDIATFALLLLDADLAVRQANQAAEDLIGASARRMTGQHLFDLAVFEDKRIAQRIAGCPSLEWRDFDANDNVYSRLRGVAYCPRTCCTNRRTPADRQGFRRNF